MCTDISFIFTELFGAPGFPGFRPIISECDYKDTTKIANMQEKHKKTQKYLVNSKKSSNFARFFDKKCIIVSLWRLH
jgi:hypothetical protein